MKINEKYNVVKLPHNAKFFVMCKQIARKEAGFVIYRDNIILGCIDGKTYARLCRDRKGIGECMPLLTIKKLSK